jgi:hypothetical protein
MLTCLQGRHVRVEISYGEYLCWRHFLARSQYSRCPDVILCSNFTMTIDVTESGMQEDSLPHQRAPPMSLQVCGQKDSRFETPHLSEHLAFQAQLYTDMSQTKAQQAPAHKHGA